jgi:hypothetical protein
MRWRRTDRSRRSAGAWLGGGRHRFVIMYIRLSCHECRQGRMSRMPERCRVTDTGKAACHEFRGIGGGKGWRCRGIGGSVGGRAQHREATTRMPEHQPGEPAFATGLYLEVNVFDTRDRLVTCQPSSALFLAFLLANHGLGLLPVLLLASLRPAIGFPKVVCPFPDAVLARWCILLWIIGHDSAPGNGLTRRGF